MIKTWGRVLLGGISKKFLTHKCISSNLNAIDLKLLRNQGGMHRFRKKFKKDSGDVNPLGVYRNKIICILKINCEGLGW